MYDGAPATKITLLRPVDVARSEAARAEDKLRLFEAMGEGAAGGLGGVGARVAALLQVRVQAPSVSLIYASYHAPLDTVLVQDWALTATQLALSREPQNPGPRAVGLKSALGHIYDVQGRWDLAEPYFKDSLVQVCVACYGSKAQSSFFAYHPQAKQMLGDRHPTTAAAAAHLALLYWREKQPDQALPLYEDMYHHRRHAKGSLHKSTLDVQSQLTSVYEAVRHRVASHRITPFGPTVTTPAGKPHTHLLSLSLASVRITCTCAGGAAARRGGGGRALLGGHGQGAGPSPPPPLPPASPSQCTTDPPPRAPRLRPACPL